jgi:hypothetical protein
MVSARLLRFPPAVEVKEKEFTSAIKASVMKEKT